MTSTDLALPASLRRRPLAIRLLVWSLAAVVFLLGLALMLALVRAQTGLTAMVLGIGLSLMVVGIVVPVLLWADRFEPEPPGMLLFAFAWGACFATLGAAFLNDIGAYLIGATGDNNPLVAMAIAPPVEETLKALGPLLLLLFRRREIDGVLDGIVYAGLAGAGFAVVEDVLYLANGYAESGRNGLLSTFIVRVLMSPFAHPMFTACTGIGLGIAATRRSWAARIFAPLLGWCCAVVLHALWNSLALASERGWLLLYVVVQLPLFVGFVVLLVSLRRAEGRKIAAQLSAYVPLGWLTPAEVYMVSTLSERRYARAWASSHGGRPLSRQMRLFQDVTTELAMTRARLVRGPVTPRDVQDERQLLDAAWALRQPFLGTPLYRFHGWQRTYG
ncbi:PrsW family intramembrane metalloprotease [Calidifontibacter sp. DB0510]|uniref:PrsW family intramembrane metalloprotease n=1 Tax=Metallococcus carri TaxID=1656884 RepID=A0A967B1K6_9MICO|nr:PrsW family intramembrane metalloprotease [Metallococcus carri]NHN55813.1 PrsW family intramembrane metalloprotease [Metallococcus carri]NOP38499.1 PrsW family intramembrane metalloprotease [Calidifontibacter sp. DB2511S]